MAHAVALAAALLWSGRSEAPPPAAEHGVEIVWDDRSGEAVGEDSAPEPPGAPPSPPAPEAAEAPEAPGTVDLPPMPDAVAMPQPPTPPPLPPPAPQLAEAAPAPVPAPDVPPPDELPAPDLPAPPVAPPVPEVPPSGEPEAPPVPPPEPPPAAPPPPSRPLRQPPSETNRRGGHASGPSAAGVGRATGAAVAPGLDPSYRNTAPAYPEAARLRGDQGAVGLEVSIDARGRVTGVTVARSSGFPALDRAARDAVSAWRFRPATVDGAPVPGSIRTTIHFRLN